jgi:hypothetical protein
MNGILKEIHWIINHLCFMARWLATTAMNVSFLTNLSAAEAAVSVLRSLSQMELNDRSLQRYFKGE